MSAEGCVLPSQLRCLRRRRAWDRWSGNEFVCADGDRIHDHGVVGGRRSKQRRISERIKRCSLLVQSLLDREGASVVAGTSHGAARRFVDDSGPMRPGAGGQRSFPSVLLGGLVRGDLVSRWLDGVVPRTRRGAGAVALVETVGLAGVDVLDAGAGGGPDRSIASSSRWRSAAAVMYTGDFMARSSRTPLATKARMKPRSAPPNRPPMNVAPGKHAITS